MNFGMVILNQNIKTMQNYVIWILATLLFKLKLGMFMKTLQMMFKKDLINQIMKLIDHCLQKSNEKVIGLMKDKLGGKIMKELGLFP